ncbi:hypothetical protein L5F25_01580 [Aliarcobacter butzleri]|uniref:hypothetical protein n=1 Tax=Aliarcobacter butzleri TaxID=28197 RepID=UPI001EDC721D|nr:hypothetical protein [Aliarcobacter butzleri]MCG3707683.1 hypothetical protein [Aliarcobacter butzleri]
MNKNIQYNLLSLVNVFVGFLFILYLGRKFGAGNETDIYFLSMVIIGYLGYFVQAVWEAMSPYYIDLKVKDKIQSDKMYSVLLNNLICVALVIISMYFIFTSWFDLLSLVQTDFLNVFIFYLLLQNILIFNKTILNLEHFYASYYLVDILVYFILFVTVIFFVTDNQISYLAYATLFGTFLAIVWQLYLIRKKLDIKYSIVLYDSNLFEIYKNSFKLKLGSLLYGSKDIVIASVFTSFGSGMYSLYSYANKFASVILQVVNAPVVNIFVTKANYHVAKNHYSLISKDIKSVLSQTIILFSFSIGLIYFIFPYLLPLLFGNKFNSNDIVIIQFIFLIMSLFYFIVVIESPFARLLSIFKLFSWGLFINLFFGIITITFYYMQKEYSLTYSQFLYLMSIAQIFNLFFAYSGYVYFLRKTMK